MTAAVTRADAPATLPPAGRAALRAGVVGNWVDNLHVFLPLTALAPAMVMLAGPAATASTGALIVAAMLLGRPVGGIVFGRLSDALGRTRTTRVAIAGTALCALGIAAMPSHELLGAGTLALVLALRFLGGIFVAGEYSAAIPLAMEWSRPRRRGLMSGLILSMAPLAQASIAFAVGALLLLLGPEAYAAWGWRALFVLGALASLGMLAYYGRHVVDAPIPPRRSRAAAGGSTDLTLDGSAPGRSSPAAASPVHGTPADAAPTDGPRAGVRQVLLGRWAPAFWQVFVMMSGLWLLTNVTVLLLTARLATDSGLPATGVSWAIGIASIAQAFAMAAAGHLSTRTGRRALLIGWGVLAVCAGPLLWTLAISSTTMARAALCAAVLQVITVSAYGPIAAYLSERFPTEVRSTGYGMGYSLSLVIPALHPFYLPAIESVLGRQESVIALLVLGGALLALGAALGPKLAPAQLEADLDTVAAPPPAPAPTAAPPPGTDPAPATTSAAPTTIPTIPTAPTAPTASTTPTTSTHQEDRR